MHICSPSGVTSMEMSGAEILDNSLVLNFDLRFKNLSVQLKKRLEEGMRVYQCIRGHSLMVRNATVLLLEGSVQMKIGSLTQNLSNTLGTNIKVVYNETEEVTVESDTAIFCVIRLDDYLALGSDVQTLKNGESNFSSIHPVNNYKSVEDFNLFALNLSPKSDSEVLEISNNNRISTESILNLLRETGSSLKCVTINNIPNFDDECMTTLCNIVPYQLERLSITQCRNLSKNAISKMARLICGPLKILKLRRLAGITDDSVFKMLSYQDETVCERFSSNNQWPKKPRLPNLIELDIGDCPFITRRGLKCLLIECPNLETLVLDHCKGLDERLSKIMEEPTLDLRRLKNLNLAYCTRVLIDRSVAAIVKALPGLEHICIDGSQHCTEKSLEMLNFMRSVSTADCALIPTKVAMGAVIMTS